MNSTQRSEPGLEQIAIHGGIADFSQLEIRYEDGTRRELSRTEANLLAYLAANSGRAVSRDELLAGVWHLNPRRICTRTVDMHVAKLRQKLHDNAGHPSALFTVPRFGYMLVSPARDCAPVEGNVAGKRPSRTPLVGLALALLVASLLLPVSAQAQNGLRAEYFNSETFTGVPVMRIDPTINFNWGAGSPALGVAAERFSVRWTGELQPRADETYTFHTGSDDGVRVWVNGRRIISNWQPHILTTNAGSISLKAAQRYRIQVDFYDRTVDAICSLGWSSPSQPYEIVPSSHLFTPAPASNRPPNLPILVLPVVDNTSVDRRNFLMRTESFSDPDSVDEHVCSEWEIWKGNFSERVWFSSCTPTNIRMARLSDGIFENSHAGRNSLRSRERYVLRVRHRDDSGIAATEWSDWAERTFNTDQPIFTLVPQGATWKYRDDGANLLTSWRLTNYNDATWLAGPAQLGVGDGDEETVVCCDSGPRTTTYFRHRFFVNNPGVLTNTVVRLLRDDGGVVYINGVEAFRNNMPAGLITYSTLASSSASEPAESHQFYSAQIPAGLIRGGTNVVAVEIHQSSSTSSDVSFDLQLVAVELPPAPALRIERDDPGCAVITWQDDEAVLEEANDVLGPWVDVPGNPGSPYAACRAQTVYFRLRKD